MRSSRRCLGRCLSGSAKNRERWRGSSPHRPRRSGPAGREGRASDYRHRCRPRGRHRRAGRAHRGRRSVRDRAAVLTKAAEALRGRRAELAALEVASVPSRGSKPMRTCVRQSTSWSTTRGWRSTSKSDRFRHFTASETSSPHPAGGEWSHIALELPAGDPDRHGLRCACERECCCAQARGAVTRARVRLRRGAARGGSARGSAASAPRRGRCRAALVRHPGVATIAFTGSLTGRTGDHRGSRSDSAPAATRKAGGAEMGGKNCVVVDADADLDQAVPAIVDSGFGYAGQKCSAAARLMVVEAIVDELVERLVGATGLLDVGHPAVFATQLPPLIEQSAQQRVRSTRTAAARRRSAAGVPSRYLSGLVRRPPGRRRPRSAGESGSPARGGLRPAPDRRTRRGASSGARRRRVARLRTHRRASYPATRPPSNTPPPAHPVGNLYVNRAITGARVGRSRLAATAARGRIQGRRARLPASVRRGPAADASRQTVRHGLVV